MREVPGLASAFFWSLASGFGVFGLGLGVGFFLVLGLGLGVGFFLVLGVGFWLGSAFFWSLASGFFSWAWVGAVTRASNAPVISRARVARGIQPRSRL